jgi:staphylococcal nuclease domain-containing protein 1
MSSQAILPWQAPINQKKGDLCAAKFVDGQWYRAKVEKSSGSKEVSVLYIDYGNRATIPKANCGTLPGNFVSLPAFAHEYTLALCNLCSDEDYAEQGLKAMREDLLDKELKLNVEYRVTGQEFASIVDSNGEDIGKNLILDGLMLAEKKGGRKLAKLVDSYRDAMESAKKNHLNIWEYGDITADDAREFGVGVKR